MNPSYDQDYYLWFVDQARLLRKGMWQQFDVEHLAEEPEDSYISAKLLAAGETGLPEVEFPSTCPFTLEQFLDEHYWPEA